VALTDVHVILMEKFAVLWFKVKCKEFNVKCIRTLCMFLHDIFQLLMAFIHQNISKEHVAVHGVSLQF